MPLERESEYWDRIGTFVVREDSVKADNIWKRRHQVQRLLRWTWLDQDVLEIGVGNGVVASSLQMTIQGMWNYIGTELGASFRRFLKTWNLNVVEADVLDLPNGPFSRIIALDSLEHVRPEHREQGYKNIAAVAKDGCLLFIHYSHSESHHDKEFDHPFGLKDLTELEGVGFKLVQFERYKCEHPNGPLDYVFAVLQK